MKFTNASSSTSPSTCTMPDASAAVAAPAGENLNPRNLKPCCACPVTKSARDDCFIKYPGDEAAVKCADLIEQHKACMRGYGFKI